MTDTTSSTAPATDPVQSVSPNHTQDFGTQSTTTTDPNLAAELQSIKEMLSAKKSGVEPTTPEQEQQVERPTGGLNDITTDDIDDPSIKRIVQLVDTHYPHLDRQRIMGKALEFGDPDFIDVNYLRDQIGDQADILIPFLEEIVETSQQSYESLVQGIYQEVGGQERWQGIAQVFTQTAPASIRNVAKQLIDSQDINQISQGIRLILDYSEQSGIAPKPPRLIQGQGFTQGGGQALSAEDFKAELAKIGSRNSNPRNYDKLVTELRQRRALGIELGL